MCFCTCVCKEATKESSIAEAQAHIRIGLMAHTDTHPQKKYIARDEAMTTHKTCEKRARWQRGNEKK